MCMLNQIQLYSYIPRSDVCDFPPSPPSPRRPASFHNSGGHVGLYKLQPDRAAQSLMSERSRISRTTRWGKRERGASSPLRPLTQPNFKQLSFNRPRWPFTWRLDYELHILHLRRRQHRGAATGARSSPGFLMSRSKTPVIRNLFFSCSLNKRAERMWNLHVVYFKLQFQGSLMRLVVERLIESWGFTHWMAFIMWCCWS